MRLSAREGSFLATRDNPDTIILRLVDGTLIQDTGKASPRILSFTLHDLPIDLPKIEKFRQRGDKEREYVLPELLRIGWSKDEPQDRRVQSLASLNYRLVEVVMMLLLPLLAVALAVPPKRSTSALGVFVSIVLVVAYHKVNQYGADVAALGMIHPFIALWGPFFLFAALILWMYYQVAFVPGGQAIGALESVYAKIMSYLKRFSPQQRRIAAMKAKHAA